MQTAIVTTPQHHSLRRSVRTGKVQCAQIDWRGVDSLGAGIALIRRGQVVEIHLPSHCRERLGSSIGMPEAAPTSDGPGLLGALSQVRGLELIGLLILPVQIVDARVRFILDGPPRLLIAPRRPVPADNG